MKELVFILLFAAFVHPALGGAIPSRFDNEEFKGIAKKNRTVALQSRTIGAEEICSSKNCQSCLPAPKMSMLMSRDAAQDTEINLSASNNRGRIVSRDFLMRRVLDPPRDARNMGPQITEWVRDAKNQGHLLGMGFEIATDLEWMTARAWELKNGKATFAVSELFGCASVILITQTHIYINHIWENVFTANQLNPNFYTLLQYADPAHPSESWPLAYTPFLTPMNAFIDCILVVPRERGRNAAANSQLYPWNNDILASYMQQIVTPLARKHPLRLLYTPWVRSENNGMGAPADSTYGKVVIRYDPALENCNGIQKAGLEVWVDGQVAYRTSWVALANQVVRRDLKERDACSRPSTSATSPQTSKSKSTSSPPPPLPSSSKAIHLACTHVRDSAVQTDVCACASGVKVPIVSGAPKPCPWTDLKDVPTSKSSSSTKPPLPALTNPPDYPFTTLFADGAIEACQISTLLHYGGPAYTETMCAGSSVFIKNDPIRTQPSVSIRYGQHYQNVGTLTGMELYTSISSALEKICPTPLINGQVTNCSTKIITISKIVYISKSSSVTDTVLDFVKSVLASRDTSPRRPSPLEMAAHAISLRESGPLSMNQIPTRHNGALEIRVEDSKYTTTKMRNAMIRSAATVANVSSTSPGSCKIHQLKQDVELNLVAEQVLCVAAEFAGIRYYDGTLTHIGDADLDARWESVHHTSPGQEIVCNILMGVMDAALVAVAPEFAVADTMVGEFIYSQCMKGVG